MTPLTSACLYDMAFADAIPTCVAIHLMRAADELAHLEACAREGELEREHARPTLVVPAACETEQGP